MRVASMKALPTDDELTAAFVAGEFPERESVPVSRSLTTPVSLISKRRPCVNRCCLPSAHPPLLPRPPPI